MGNLRASEGQQIRFGNRGLSSIALFFMWLLHTGSAAAINITMPPNTSDGSCINSTLDFNGLGRPAVTKTIDKIAACDLTFVVLYGPGDVNNANNSTSLNFLESVTNSSGTTWHDYHFQIGNGVGDGFVPATTTIAPHFDGPNLGQLIATSTGFILDSGQSGVGLLHSLDFSSSVGVPSGPNIIEFDFNVFFRNCPLGTLECREEFTLRQTPTITIPEPTTIALLAIGLFGVSFARKRRATEWT